MPKIPVYEGRGQITPQAPVIRRPVGTARRPGEEIARAGELQIRAGEAVAGIGRTLAGIGQMFAQARDLEQYTKAKTNIAKSLIEVESKALSTEINTTEDFNEVIKTSSEELSKIKDDILPTIVNPEIKLKIEGAYDLSALGTLNSIKSNSRKRWIKAMKSSMVEGVEEETQFYLETANKSMAIDNIRELIKNHIELGVIDRTVGNKYLKDTLESLPVLDAEHWINKEPSMAREMLGRKLFGVKDAKERERLFKLAGTTLERNKKEAKWNFNIKRNEEEQEAATMIIDKNITTISQIDKLPRASLKFKEAAKRLLLSGGKMDSVELGTNYEKLRREYYSLPLDRDGNVNAGLEKLARFRINLMMAHDKKIITDASYKNTLDIINGAYSAGLGDIVKAKFKQGKEIRGWWDSLWTLGERALPEEDRDDAMMFLDKELTNILLEREIPEGEIRDTAISILKKYIREVAPEILGLPEIPNGIMEKEKKLTTFPVEQTKTTPERVIRTKPDTVLMQAPDGELGYIPIENIDKATERGYIIWQRRQ